MSGIPLDLQRRFEQRWAARFAKPVASAAPKSIVVKEAVSTPKRPPKATEKPTGLSQQA
jgi:hypothetical protein